MIHSLEPIFLTPLVAVTDAQTTNAPVTAFPTFNTTKILEHTSIESGKIVI